MKKYIYILIVIFIFYGTMSPFIAGADETDGRWRVQLSPYTLHFDPKDDHRAVWMVGLEWESSRRWLIGGTFFKNSFGQPSWFWYGGYRWDGSKFLKGSYAKVAAGIIVGYDGPNEDNIPLNWDGVGLGAIPAIGWKYERFELQLNLLGSAGLMMSLSIDFFP